MAALFTHKTEAASVDDDNIVQEFLASGYSDKEKNLSDVQPDDIGLANVSFQTGVTLKEIIPKNLAETEVAALDETFNRNDASSMAVKGLMQMLAGVHPSSLKRALACPIFLKSFGSIVNVVPGEYLDQLVAPLSSLDVDTALDFVGTLKSDLHKFQKTYVNLIELGVPLPELHYKPPTDQNNAAAHAISSVIGLPKGLADDWMFKIEVISQFEWAKKSDHPYSYGVFLSNEDRGYVGYRPGGQLEVLVHELLHTIGSVRPLVGGPVNEGFTEYLTKLICNKEEIDYKPSYAPNVGFVESIVKIIGDSGNQLVAEAYKSKDLSKFQEAYVVAGGSQNQFEKAIMYAEEENWEFAARILQVRRSFDKGALPGARQLDAATQKAVTQNTGTELNENTTLG